MASQSTGMIAPLAAPLPPPPEGDILTADQWTTLLAIGDAVIPAIASSSSQSHNTLGISPAEYTSAVDVLKSSSTAATNPELAHTYLSERASDIPALKEQLFRQLNQFTPPDSVQSIAVVLSTLK